MTPFKKKFPNADKDTVFVLTKFDSVLSWVGDRLMIKHDDGSRCPYFYNLSKENQYICPGLDNIELADQPPKFKFGEEVQVRNGDTREWLKCWFTYDTHDLKDVVHLSDHMLRYRYCTVIKTGSREGFSQIRKLPQTQTVTLECGEVITVSNETVQELRKKRINDNDGEV